MKRNVGLLVLIAVVVAAIVVVNPVVIVGPGERGVILTFGKVGGTSLGEGLHIVMPIVQSVKIMDVKIQKTEATADAATKDMQETSSKIVLNFHVSPEHANTVYQTIGKRYEEIIINPAIQEITKAITAKYAAVELITQRDKVGQEIQSALRERLGVNNLIVDNFSIVNFSFSRDFMAAIEAKQTAEQNALKAQRDLDRIKIEAEQKVAAARAEAEALRMQKENVSPQLIELRKVEAQIRAIDKWNGVMPQVTSGGVPFLNLDVKH